ncbi:30S ribosomal protein S9 [Chryseotalea sanaruensis]|jgi:small subunit ribosomal protein S9|uniref:Small ribosomal subunit protein uS9 n=1 Tax=Chryseotalea sanaruensis TaxID=2482724 RepID=A0A401UBM4_9BACT|nr:30S ribosomal protein S9 [Chryseotalea sanaruensis]GCC52308.1 30S ribosomal protein S9 [Chryseotalea sanaruensis]
METKNAVGRRKTSIARVYITPGNGAILINNRELKTYFLSEIHQTTVKQPLAATKLEGQYDVTINVEGGGIKGQAEAIRLGIARALVRISEENRAALKTDNLLTRDSRMVERKKFGRAKARKRFQFSKR